MGSSNTLAQSFEFIDPQVHIRPPVNSPWRLDRYLSDRRYFLGEVAHKGHILRAQDDKCLLNTRRIISLSTHNLPIWQHIDLLRQ
jgi:hypothetical protein